MLTIRAMSNGYAAHHLVHKIQVDISRTGAQTAWLLRERSPLTEPIPRADFQGIRVPKA